MLRYFIPLFRVDCRAFHIHSSLIALYYFLHILIHLFIPARLSYIIILLFSLARPLYISYHIISLYFTAWPPSFHFFDQTIPIYLSQNLYLLFQHLINILTQSKVNYWWNLNNQSGISTETKLGRWTFFNSERFFLFNFFLASRSW